MGENLGDLGFRDELKKKKTNVSSIKEKKMINRTSLKLKVFKSHC